MVIPADLVRELGVQALLDREAYAAALEALIPVLYEGPEPRRAQAAAIRDAILGQLREAVRTATHPPRTPMRFGTSGWRGLLYDDFTVRNVACVTQGLIDALVDPRLHTPWAWRAPRSAAPAGASWRTMPASWAPSSWRPPGASSSPTACG